MTFLCVLLHLLTSAINGICNGLNVHNAWDTISKLHSVLYRIAGIFHGARFSWMVDLYHFTDLIFMDAHTHAHYILYNQAYFMGLIIHENRENWTPSKISCYTVVVCVTALSTIYICF